MAITTVADASHTATESLCPNCGAVAGGAFCPGCGQEQRDLVPTVREWLADALDEVFALNGRLPRTLRLLFSQPGRLTIEWREGRRERHIRPFKLYLVLSALCFFVLGLDAEGGVEGWNAALETWPPEIPREAARRAGPALMANADLLVLLLMVPVGAVVAGLALGRRRPRFVERLVFSIHVHALGMILFLVFMPVWSPLKRLLATLTGSDGAVYAAFGVLLAAALTYLALAMRRAYALSTGRTLLATAAAGVSYVALFFASLFLVVMVAIGLAAIR